MEHRGIISHSPDSSSESGLKRKDAEKKKVASGKSPSVSSDENEELNDLSSEPEEKKQKQEEKKPTKEEEQEEEERVAPQMGVVPGIAKSTKEQQTAAEELVKTFQPYEGDDPIPHLETIIKQFQALQPYLVPEHTKDGQGMWEDTDPLTTICYDGISTIYKNILDNKPLEKVCQQGELAISPILGNKKYTLLDFLKDTLGNYDTCSQAVEGEMKRWIKRIGKQVKALKGEK